MKTAALLLLALTATSLHASMKSHEERQSEKFIAGELAEMPAPFGIKLGSIYTTGELPASNEDGLRLYKVSPPNPNQNFSKFAVYVSSKTDRVKRVIGYYEGDEEKAMKAQFKSVLEILTRSYGKPKEGAAGKITYSWNETDFSIVLSYYKGESYILIFEGAPRFDIWIHP